MKKTLILICALVFSTQLLVAQTSNKIADNLFDKKSYNKAAKEYLNDDKTQIVMERLGDCYYFTGDFDNAAKWYDLLLRKHEAEVEPIYYFRFSQTLKALEDYETADIWGQKYSEKHGNTIEQIAAIGGKTKVYQHPINISINTEASEFGPFIYGNEVVFASSRGGSNKHAINNRGFYNLYSGTIDQNFDVIDAVPFSTELNSSRHESSAVFTKDSTTVYFTRNVKSTRSKKDKGVHMRIFRAELVEGKWNNITDLPFNNNDYSVAHPALSVDESRLYFSSNMPGSLGESDLYYVDITESGFGAPVNLGEGINTDQREQFPYISAENILYFASDGHLGLGGLDIFKANINNGEVGFPVNLGNEINSNMDDFGLVIDSARDYGYFTSNRTGGKGDDDIYLFNRNVKVMLTGVVKDKHNTEKLLDSTLITLLNKEGNVIADTIVGADARYEFPVYGNSEYTIKATKALYIPYDVSFKTNKEGEIDKEIFLILESYADAEALIANDTIKIANIHFDSKKWAIKDIDKPELDKVADILVKYPEMSIEISAHTDYIGSKNYNLKLSKKRAKAAKDYIVSKGASEEQITTIGYGEMQPINECTLDESCTLEENDLNRRCEFILKK